MQKAQPLILSLLFLLAMPCLAQGAPNAPDTIPQATPPDPAVGFTPRVHAAPTFQQNAGYSTAAPGAPGAAPDGYRLNPGDTLEFDFRLSPELNQVLTIDPDGSVGMLVIGRVHLAGLTVAEARQYILSKEAEHLVKPEINIQLTNYQHLYVVVAGEVYIPQRIEMREPMTALQAVTMAGGFRSTGRETSVLLYRRVNDQIAQVYNLNLKIKKNSQIENDMTLRPGDLIVVQRSKVESVARYVRLVGLSYPIATPAY